MQDEALIKKLRLSPSQKILILNPPPGYTDRLGSLPWEPEAAPEQPAGYDFVHLFVKNQAELAEWAPKALEAVAYDGLFWLSYPKGTSKINTDLNRDKGWEPVWAAGLEGIVQVSVDETWSATRFRPSDMVRKGRAGKEKVSKA